VWTNLEYSRSDRVADLNEKFFSESYFSQHYDGRFAAHPLEVDERLAQLRAIIQTFLAGKHNSLPGQTLQHDGVPF
jgi:hypothetical protein